MREGRAPVGLVAAAWAVSGAADQAMLELEQGSRERRSALIDAVVLVIDAGGAARVKGTGDVADGRGAVLGGVLGAGLGLVTSGPGWLQLGGGMISALAARACEGGLPGARLRALGERLVPHASAIVAVIEHRQVAGVKRDLAALRADVVTEMVSPVLVMRLGVAPAVVYCRGEVNGDVVATRTNAPERPPGQAWNSPGAGEAGQPGAGLTVHHDRQQ